MPSRAIAIGLLLTLATGVFVAAGFAARPGISREAPTLEDVATCPPSSRPVLFAFEGSPPATGVVVAATAVEFNPTEEAVGVSFPVGHHKVFRIERGRAMLVAHSVVFASSQFIAEIPPGGVAEPQTQDVWRASAHEPGPYLYKYEGSGTCGFQLFRVA